jgi:hypothetical protein
MLGGEGNEAGRITPPERPALWTAKEHPRPSGQTGGHLRCWGGETPFETGGRAARRSMRRGRSTNASLGVAEPPHWRNHDRGTSALPGKSALARLPVL